MAAIDHAQTVLLYGTGFLLASILFELSGPAPFKGYFHFGKTRVACRQRYLKTEAQKFIAARLMSYLGIVMILLGLFLILLRHLTAA